MLQFRHIPDERFHLDGEDPTGLPVFRPGFLQNTVSRGLLWGYGYEEYLHRPDDHVTLILAHASGNEFPHQL